MRAIRKYMFCHFHMKIYVVNKILNNKIKNTLLTYQCPSVFAEGTRSRVMIECEIEWIYISDTKVSSDWTHAVQCSFQSSLQLYICDFNYKVEENTYSLS